MSPNENQPSSDARADSETGPVCKNRIVDPDELDRVTKNLVQELLNHKSIEVCVKRILDNMVHWFSMIVSVLIMVFYVAGGYLSSYGFL